MHTKGILYTVLSAVLFGITPLITRAVYGYGANSMTVVFYRSLFVIPMLAAIMKGRHISFSISAHPNFPKQPNLYPQLFHIPNPLASCHRLLHWRS